MEECAMTNVYDLKPFRYHTVWISDVHLGYRGCKAEFLLNFLHRVQCDTLYLVGDIIDVWSMKRGVFWPQAHNNVLRALLGKAKHETRVVYIPGNHDALFCEHCGQEFGNISIQQQALHTTVRGERLLIMHGDEFDSVINCNRLVSMFGSWAYDLLLMANGLVAGVRRHSGMGSWSLAGSIKHKVRNAVNYINEFEGAVALAAEKNEVDGLVCGHIHHHGIRRINDLLYCNCGDTVENCTALIGRHDGELELIRWTDDRCLSVGGSGQPAQREAV
jgi:UDP-2,3-diacylglucosamine pyrophosphatase LpxH